jgi:hypothetical protein
MELLFFICLFIFGFTFLGTLAAEGSPVGFWGIGILLVLFFFGGGGIVGTLLVGLALFCSASGYCSHGSSGYSGSTRYHHHYHHRR